MKRDGVMGSKTEVAVGGEEMDDVGGEDDEDQKRFEPPRRSLRVKKEKK